MSSFFVILLASYFMYKHSSASTEFIVPAFVLVMTALIIFAGTFKKFQIDPIQLLNTAYIMNFITSFLFSPTYVNSFICRLIYNLMILYCMIIRVFYVNLEVSVGLYNYLMISLTVELNLYI
jgi:hypothetical protein